MQSLSRSFWKSREPNKIVASSVFKQKRYLSFLFPGYTRILLVFSLYFILFLLFFHQQFNPYYFFSLNPLIPQISYTKTNLFIIFFFLILLFRPSSIYCMSLPSFLSFLSFSSTPSIILHLFTLSIDLFLRIPIFLFISISSSPLYFSSSGLLIGSHPWSCERRSGISVAVTNFYFFVFASGVSVLLSVLFYFWSFLCFNLSHAVLAGRIWPCVWRRLRQQKRFRWGRLQDRHWLQRQGKWKSWKTFEGEAY